MLKHDPLVVLAYRLSENQNAIGSAIAELAAWAESCGSTVIAERVRTHLHTLVDNAVPIAAAIHELRRLSASQRKVADHRPSTSSDQSHTPLR
ncbi:hypothetical protein D9M68_628260 [compost metagenome]